MLRHGEYLTLRGSERFLCFGIKLNRMFDECPRDQVVTIR